MGFAQKNAKSVFGFENPGLDFPKNMHRNSLQLGMFFNIIIILSKFAIQHSNHMARMCQWNSLQIGILNGGYVSTH